MDKQTARPADVSAGRAVFHFCGGERRLPPKLAGNGPGVLAKDEKLAPLFFLSAPQEDSMGRISMVG
jgi:hypothetical protein